MSTYPVAITNYEEGEYGCTRNDEREQSNISMMNTKIIGLRVAGTIFGIVAVLHLLWVVMGISVVIDGWMLPVWMNVIGLW